MDVDASSASDGTVKSGGNAGPRVALFNAGLGPPVLPSLPHTTSEKNTYAGGVPSTDRGGTGHDAQSSGHDCPMGD